MTLTESSRTPTEEQVSEARRMLFTQAIDELKPWIEENVNLSQIDEVILIPPSLNGFQSAHEVKTDKNTFVIIVTNAEEISRLNDSPQTQEHLDYDSFLQFHEDSHAWILCITPRLLDQPVFAPYVKHETANPFGALMLAKFDIAPIDPETFFQAKTSDIVQQHLSTKKSSAKKGKLRTFLGI